MGRILKDKETLGNRFGELKLDSTAAGYIDSISPGWVSTTPHQDSALTHTHLWFRYRGSHACRDCNCSCGLAGNGRLGHLMALGGPHPQPLTTRLAPSPQKNRAEDSPSPGDMRSTEPRAGIEWRWGGSSHRAWRLHTRTPSAIFSCVLAARPPSQPPAARQLAGIRHKLSGFPAQHAKLGLTSPSINTFKGVHRDSKVAKREGGGRSTILSGIPGHPHLLLNLTPASECADPLRPTPRCLAVPSHRHRQAASWLGASCLGSPHVRASGALPVQSAAPEVRSSIGYRGEIPWHLNPGLIQEGSCHSARTATSQALVYWTVKWVTRRAYAGRVSAIARLS